MKKTVCHPRFISFVCIVLVCSALCGFYLIDNARFPETALMSASWSYNYSDLEELTQNSDLIARISVEDASYYTTDQGIPMTNYTANIDLPIYGCTEDNSIDIVMTGGPDDGVIFEIADDSLMNIDDDFIIFARQNDNGTYTILSGPQGRMSIENGLVSSLNVSNSQVRANHIGSNISVQNVPLDDFVAEINSYIE